jgi:uncharacterized membrane protein YeaQ/YmgE (transglycosylase-associated protein family)
MIVNEAKIQLAFCSTSLWEAGRVLMAISVLCPHNRRFRGSISRDLLFGPASALRGGFRVAGQLSILFFSVKPTLPQIPSYRATTSCSPKVGVMHILWWVIVGLIAGWATGKIMRGRGFGPLMDIVIGIVGAVIGGWIMRALGGSGEGGMIYTILVAILGAVILTWLVRLIAGNRSSGPGGLRRAA